MSRGRKNEKNKGGRRGNSLEITLVDARARTRVLVVPGPQLGWEWRERGQQLLVIPSAQARWEQSSTLWRSVLLRRQTSGLTVLSVGLPKFWGPQENHASAQALEKEVAAGLRVHASAKADGQLLIRAVYENRVTWRTRSNITIDEAAERALAPLLAAHPLLSDSSWQDKNSLQFELCLARQRIVVAHPQDRLILVGASAHTSLLPLPWSQVSAIAEDSGCELAATLPLTGTTTRAWTRAVEEWARAHLLDEGVVIRDESGYPRLRLKSSAYERAFRLRYEYPPAAIYRSWQKEKNRKSGSEIAPAVLKALTVNPADTTQVLASLQAFENKDEQVLAQLQELKVIVEAARATSSRSAFAKTAAAYATPLGPVALKLWDGDEAGALTALSAHAINRLHEHLSALTIIAPASRS
jgi:hypothetical protein